MVTLDGTPLVEYKEISEVYAGGPTLNKKLQNQLNQYSDRYEEGTDYYHLTGDLLRRFKLENPEKAKSSHFIAWTRQGAVKLCTNVGLDPKIIETEFITGQALDPQVPNTGKLVGAVISHVNNLSESREVIMKYLDTLQNTQKSLIPQITDLIRSLR